MRKLISLLLIISLFLSLFTACVDKDPGTPIKPDVVTKGEVSDGYYINKDMGFKIQVPKDYYQASEEELGSMFSMREIFGDDEIEETVNYLAFFSKDIIDEMENNSHIMIAVEDADNFRYMNKDSYVENMSVAKAELYRDIKGAKVSLSNQKSVWLDTRKFANRSVTLNIDEFEITFDMFAVVKNGYFLSIIIGAYNQEDLEYLRSIVNSLVFQ